MNLKIIVLFVLLLLPEILCAAEPAKSTLVKFGWPVGVSATAPDEVKKIAKDISETLVHKWVLEQTGNPICALWVELAAKPNPHEDYYLVIIQGGGGVVTATDVKQLQLAADAIKAAVQVKDQAAYLPVGILTNLAVNKAP